MTTTTGTHTSEAGQDGPPAPEQLLEELVTWLSYLPAARRALIASALVHNRWELTLAAVCRQAVDELVKAAQAQQIPHPYEHVARQLGVGDSDPDVDVRCELADQSLQVFGWVTGDRHAVDAGIEPAVEEAGSAADSARQTGGVPR